MLSVEGRLQKAELSLTVAWPGWLVGLLSGLVFGTALAFLLGLPPAHPLAAVILLAVPLAGIGFGVGIRRPVAAQPLPDLILMLGIPLFSAITLFFALGRVVTSARWRDLFFDLGVAAIGVLFTVFLIERIIEHDREARWAGVDRFALGDLNNAAAGVLTRIVALNPTLEPPGMVYELGGEADLATLNEEYVRFVESRVTEHLNTSLPRLNFEGLSPYATALAQIVQDFEQVLRIYGDRLRPELVAKIHQIRTSANGALTLIRLMPTTPLITAQWIVTPMQLLIHEAIDLMHNCDPLLKEAAEHRRIHRLLTRDR